MPKERMVDELTWIKFSAQALEALIARDLDRASALMKIQLDPFFITDDAVSLWNYRLGQIHHDARTLDWIAQVVVANNQVIGHAGFHGPPDQAGMVEVAYSVVPVYRGRGYATAMLQGLLQRAISAPEVNVVRATISPDNVASLATIRPFPFVQAGEQWDDIDGLELIFEMATKGSQTDRNVID